MRRQQQLCMVSILRLHVGHFSLSAEAAKLVMNLYWPGAGTFQLPAGTSYFKRATKQIPALTCV